MKSKKKILLVSCWGLGNGGVQAIMMGIVRSLSDKFTFDALVFTSESRYYEKEFLSYGGEIIRIPHYEGENRYVQALDAYTRDFYIYRETKRVLKEKGPYIAVHCNKEHESAPILKAAYECGINTRICHSHVVNHKGRYIYNIINKIRQKYINKYATVKIGCSEEACRSIYIENDYRVINNFYDDSRYNPDLYEMNDKGSFLSLVQVGSLGSNKNQIFSIRILSELLKSGIEAKLTIIGFELEKAYRDRIIREIELLGLSSNVCLLPGTSNIPQILSESDVFLMPSVSEGFGIVLIEAQAMGLRCYASSSIPTATDCGGVTYIDLKEGPNFWAKKIMSDKLNTDSRKIRYNTEKFKLANIVDEYYKIYTKW